MLADAAWVWIPVVLLAALTQTVRNTAQRSLAADTGPVGAALARFLYGLPFAGLAIVALNLAGAASGLPTFSATYFLWLGLGAAVHAGGSALFIAAMRRGSFVVAVTYSKTEVVQVAVFAALLLAELPTALTLVGMVLALTGVTLLYRGEGAAPGSAQARDVLATAVLGIATGGCYAMAAVGYRAAGLELERLGQSPVVVAAWSVCLAQLGQSAAMGAYLALREPQALRAVVRSWRLSFTAGSAGAVASLCWFLAYVLRPATDVRIVGMAEVVFSYFVSHRLLRERTPWRERLAILMVVAGAVCASLGTR